MHWRKKETKRKRKKATRRLEERKEARWCIWHCGLKQRNIRRWKFTWWWFSGLFFSLSHPLFFSQYSWHIIWCQLYRTWITSGHVSVLPLIKIFMCQWPQKHSIKFEWNTLIHLLGLRKVILYLQIYNNPPPNSKSVTWCTLKLYMKTLAHIYSAQTLTEMFSYTVIPNWVCKYTHIRSVHSCKTWNALFHLLIANMNLDQRFIHK